LRRFGSQDVVGGGERLVLAAGAAEIAVETLHVGGQLVAATLGVGQQPLLGLGVGSQRRGRLRSRRRK